MKRLLIFFLIMLGLLSSVNAQLFSNQSTDSGAFVNLIGNNYGSGTTFNYSNLFQKYNINNIEIYLGKSGSPTSNSVLSIGLTNSSGHNISTICSSIINATLISPSTFVNYSFSNCNNLNSSQNYTLILTCENCTAGNYIQTRYGSPNTLFNGNMLESLGGNSYNFNYAGDLVFRFYGTWILINSLSFSNISLTNNTYFNSSSIQINTSVLNTSTNGNVNQTYYLYYNNGTFFNSTRYATNNLNGTTTINGLTDNTYKIFFYANNNETNVTSSNYTFTIDTTLPIINNNINATYYAYNISGFNSSCSDTNLLSCNILINGQNKLLNTTSFNFTTNGNQSYIITATDLANNTITATGVTLVNPIQYFRAYDSARAIYVTDPYTFGTYTSDNSYITIPLYDLGLGTHTLQFVKSGYTTSNTSFTFNTTNALNTSFNVTPVTIVIKVYDEDVPSTQLYFNLTMINSSNSTIYLNQYNFNKYYNETLTGNLTLVFDSYNYSTRKLYTQLTSDTAVSHIVYLKKTILSTSVVFRTTDLTGTQPIEDVEFIFEKYINGTLTPITEAKTDSQGYTYFNMDLTSDYKIIITKSGYVTQTINSIPGKNTYTILMEPDNIQQGFAFQDFSYQFKPITKIQTSLPFQAGVNVVDANNLLSSWTITITGDNTSFTSTSTNSAGGEVLFNITNASLKYKMNLSGMREGNYFEFIDYVSFKNQSSKVTTLITEAENMDNDPDATEDKVMLMLFIYVIFVVMGTIVSFGSSTFGAVFGLLPITLFVYLSWLPLGFGIIFGLFTILGVLYFQK